MLLVYGPQRSGKTLKIIVACHQILANAGDEENKTTSCGKSTDEINNNTMIEQTAAMDVVYINLQCAKSEIDVIATVNSQLGLQFAPTVNATRYADFHCL